MHIRMAQAQFPADKLQISQLFFDKDTGDETTTKYWMECYIKCEIQRADLEEINAMNIIEINRLRESNTHANKALRLENSNLRDHVLQLTNDCQIFLNKCSNLEQELARVQQGVPVQESPNPIFENALQIWQHNFENFHRGVDYQWALDLTEFLFDPNGKKVVPQIKMFVRNQSSLYGNQRSTKSYNLPWPKIRSEDKEDWAKVWRQLKDIQAHQVQLGLIVLERKLKNNVRKRKNYKAREQNGKKEKRDDK
ncbi:uncharacterized protein CELE_T24E12.2 [Caenorhabditis elegans]|uniref:Uncharacterized protein n=1 Tax=Caenorhabditis elegans TaxID=6239 RepID=O44884_CAEEL|nr:Uncharacterized protein CELE_T24E12.2 [Caenorhabditis elegans]CCD69329.1 Uncharacterized protein CELE_T24E12.2 [Caenorhabditis elegans]|eukprot:NP_494649.1 Uncharacterized protein CELE_T24E12.2 [Caenorhabditis elegans]